ncbi:hypothetical protein Tco_0025916 [Tanacetum coccineum]
MGTKVTSSSGSVLEEPEIQKLQMQAKISKKTIEQIECTKTTISTSLELYHDPMYYEFREAFHRLFDANEGLFRSVLSRNMQNLEKQFSKETLHEKDSNSELRAIKGQFEHFIHSKMFELSKKVIPPAENPSSIDTPFGTRYKIMMKELPQSENNSSKQKPNVLQPPGPSRNLPKACVTSVTKGKSTSFNGQKQQRIDITADALYNEKQFKPRSSTFKRRLIVADQASVFMEMTSVHISSGLVLHQMTSDHNRSELGIHDHSNEPSSSKLVPKVVPLVVKTATSQKVGITIPPSYSNAEDNR